MPVRKLSAVIRYAADRGYTVDQFGSVYGPTGKMLRLIEKRHTRMTYLSFSSQNRKIKVHRFVAFLKFGARALRRGVHVRHKNNCNHDNAWDNILLGTQSQNEHDKPATTKQAQGARLQAWRKSKEILNP